MTSTWTRYAGGAGILFVIMIVGASIAGPYLPGDQAAAALTGSVQARQAGYLVGVDLQFLAAIPFVLFLCGLYALLRTAPGDWGWLAPGALVSGVVAVASVLVAQSVLGTLTAYVAASTPAAVVRATYSVFAGIYQASDILLAIFLLIAAAGAVLARVYASWFGAVAVASAVLLVVGTFAYAQPSGPLSIVDLIGLLLFLAFVLAISITLLRGSPATAAG